MQAPPIILASASPRRRELLTLVGLNHTAVPADIDESSYPSENPRAHVERLARTKAETVQRDQHANALVIAADTVVVIDDMILGKPANPEDARVMLRRLSGRTHTVFTGIACAYQGRAVSTVECVEVTFRPLDDWEITEYIATGEPLDKAGSYGIQGFGATIVRRIDGDYFSVMGLPLVQLVELLRQLGVTYHFGSLAMCR
jgi:septum formation protein